MATPALLDHMRRRGVMKSQLRRNSAVLIDPLDGAPRGSVGAPYLPFGDHSEVANMDPRERKAELGDFVDARVRVSLKLRNRENEKRVQMKPPREVKVKLLSQREMARLGVNYQPMSTMSSAYQNPAWDATVEAADQLESQRGKIARMARQSPYGGVFA
jgi:hypothetical protein